MLTRSVKRNVLISFAAALAVVVILVLLASIRPIRIHDPGFRLISVMASRGTNQTIYFESQVVGRARERFRQIGLGGKPAETVTVALHDGDYICFSVVYAGDLRRHELETVEAELEDSTGKVTRLQQGTWVQRLPSTNRLSYRLWLTLPEGGRRLAEVRLGKL